MTIHIKQNKKQIEAWKNTKDKKKNKIKDKNKNKENIKK